MLDMFFNSVILFFRGKLFQDIGGVIRQALVGVGIGACGLIVLVKLNVPLWLAVIAMSLVTGACQPWLFRNLKYQ